jgi:AAA domain
MTPINTRTNLAPAIASSLDAKLRLLLSRPLTAEIIRNDDAFENEPIGTLASELLATGGTIEFGRDDGDDDDASCTIDVRIDYEATWNDREKEVLQNVSNAVEQTVLLLTDEQLEQFRRSPLQMLQARPRPEGVELTGYETVDAGGREIVVALELATRPEPDITHVAIIPNLVQIERQIEALRLIEASDDHGPLSPLRALVGCGELSTSMSVVERDFSDSANFDEAGLDEYQRDCVRQALESPHFAVIQGPPGSGKTTVISTVIRSELLRGGRVLVVSPTHVAVDNVVEKLVRRNEGGTDTLEPHSLPVRFAARRGKLSNAAEPYWTGPRTQHRAATLAGRLHEILKATVPGASSMYARIDPKRVDAAAPLSTAIAALAPVICGTPIGILSHPVVQNAEPATFDLLIVDEVSKLTLPEFLAIAVKARRWVLVGDPQQLPPFNDCEANGETLDDILPPELELVCSAATLLERLKPFERNQACIVVVARRPEALKDALHAHLQATALTGYPPITLHSTRSSAGGIVICDPASAIEACRQLNEAGFKYGVGRRSNPIDLLAQRDLGWPTTWAARGVKPVSLRRRAAAAMFEGAFNTFHAQPWARRAGQKLDVVTFRKGLNKSLPSRAASAALGLSDDEWASITRETALRFAVNTVSAYEWLAGIPTEAFDVSPLIELAEFVNTELASEVKPWIGTLKRQYRMAPQLSKVPRRLFYFNEALLDGPEPVSGSRPLLCPVISSPDQEERSSEECERIIKLLTALAAQPRQVMIITPYREQQSLIRDRIKAHGGAAVFAKLNLEVLTMDSCQGKEADYVIISLVRQRSSPFLNNPKRWNVALTRARKALMIVGNIDGFAEEARQARAFPHRNGEPVKMSLLARIIEEYQRISDRHPA